MLAKKSLLLLNVNIFLLFQPLTFLYSNPARTLAIFFFYQF